MTHIDRPAETPELTPAMREIAELFHDTLLLAEDGINNTRLVERLFYQPPSHRDLPYSPPQILHSLEVLSVAGCFEQEPHEVIDGENVTITLSEKGKQRLEDYEKLLGRSS